MINLGGIVDLRPTNSLHEEDVFTATSKETGTTSVFKTKDARDKAVKSGTHQMKKADKKDGEKKPGVNIFDKPKSDSSEKAPRDDKNRIIVPDDVWEKGDKYNDDWYQKKFAWITSKEEQEFINTLIKKSSPQVVDKLSKDSEKIKAVVQRQIEKKKEESKKDLDNAYKAKDFESIVSSLKGKIDDQEYEEISDEMKALEVMQDEMQDLEDDGGNTYNEKMEIDSAVEDLQDRIKQALSAKKESSTKLK